MITTTTLLLVLVLPAGAPDEGLEGLGELSKEGRSMLLSLQEAILKVERSIYTLKKAKDDYDQAQSLLQEGIYTNQDREVIQSRKSLHDANYELDQSKIDLEKRKLDFFQNASHITIVTATKYTTEDQEKRVRIGLRNSSDMEMVTLSEDLVGRLVVELERRLLADRDLGIPRDELVALLPARTGHTPEETVSLLKLENIIISLYMGNVNIGNPYEQKLEQLALDQEAEVEFTIQQDVDDLSIALDYLDKQERTNVFLQTEAEEDIVVVTSQQFAQEGELSSKVSFDLLLERYTEGEKEFRLLTLGLPKKFNHRFIENQRGGAAVRQVRFARRLRRIDLALEVDVPRELEAEELEKPIKFLAVVADSAAIKKLRPFLQNEEMPKPEVLQEMRVGFEELELVPKGIGEMEITARGFYYRTKPGREVEMRFNLENTGTSRLTDIHFDVRPGSPEWRYRLEPDKVDFIEPAQEKEILLILYSDSPMEIGEYSVAVEATCELSGQEIQAEQDSFRVAVEGETDVTLVVVILGTILVLMLGMAVVTVRISRR